MSEHEIFTSAYWGGIDLQHPLEPGEVPPKLKFAECREAARSLSDKLGAVAVGNAVLRESFRYRHGEGSRELHFPISERTLTLLIRESITKIPDYQGDKDELTASSAWPESEPYHRYWANALADYPSFVGIERAFLSPDGLSYGRRLQWGVLYQPRDPKKESALATHLFGVVSYKNGEVIVSSLALKASEPPIALPIELGKVQTRTVKQRGSLLVTHERITGVDVIDVSGQPQRAPARRWQLGLSRPVFNS